MWAYGLTPGVGVTYDPEGILSTIPAIASTLIGVLAGKWMQTNNPGNLKAMRLTLAGIALLVLAVLLSHFLPFNKRIWTSTFALLSSGVALL
jgi:predicted acyltransferase